MPSKSFLLTTRHAHREREIELLTQEQRELRRELRALKADYVSADADDVIRALRTRVQELGGEVSINAFEIANSVRDDQAFNIIREQMLELTTLLLGKHYYNLYLGE